MRQPIELPSAEIASAYLAASAPASAVRPLTRARVIRELIDEIRWLRREVVDLRAEMRRAGIDV